MNLRINGGEFKSAFVPRDQINLEEYLIVHYKLIPSENYSMEEAAVGILFTTLFVALKPLSYELPSERLKHQGYVLSVKDNGEVSLAYPLSMCSVNESITQLFVLLAFGVEYQYTEGFWIDSIEYPKSFLQRFRGPRFGIDGIRKIFGIPSRPLIGAIVGPRLGVPLSEIINISRECLLGGADFIADDLRLIDPENDLSFTKRVPILAGVAEEASRKTGENKQYFANITVSPLRAIKAAKFAREEGVGGLIVNHFAMGYGAIEDLADVAGIPIITASMGDSLLVRQQAVGISSKVMFQIARLAGVDAIHAGTSSSECYGPEAWSPSIVNIRSGLHNLISGCFAVAEGGITIADVWDNIFSLGPDVMLKACNGIIEYPGGPAKGAYAFRTLAERLSYRMNPVEAHDGIMEIASGDLVVREGLDYFGYTPKLSI